MRKRNSNIMKGILASFVLMLGLMIVPFEAEAASSGTCGNNLKWSVSGTKLTITGTGDMDWGYSSYSPWDDYKSSITSISIGSKVTSIANDAFDGFVNLQSVDIPNKVKVIGGNAFSGCSNLKSVKIGTGVETIKYHAFSNCKNLTSVTFKSTSKVETFEHNVFYGCSNLMKIELPNSLKIIGSDSFNSCSNLKTVTFGKKLTEIGGSAFRNCDNLTAITIPDSVTAIRYYAFYDCDRLATVNISEKSKLETIENETFYSCEALKAIYIPKSLKTLSGYSFQYSGIETVKFGTGCKLEKLEYDTFSHCKNLKSVVIPKNVKSIGDSCFWDCENLTSLKFQNGSKLTTIGSGAFNGCAISAVKIPKTVTKIGGSAFYNNTELSSVTLQEGLVTIGSSAFEKTSIKEIIIPDTVTLIDGSAFQDCKYLETAIIGSNVNSIGYRAFQACTSLTNVKLGNAVTTIDSHAFRECPFRTFTIPNSVQTIGSSAFSSCPNLETVRLGKSLTKISDYCFSGCKAIKTVYAFSTNTTFNKSIFQDSKNVVVYGYKDTMAESIATKCGFTFVELQSKDLTEDMFYLEKTSYTWDGMEKMPLVYSVDSNLQEGYDFVALYDYESKAGTHYVEVFGENEYNGAYVQLEYKINKRKLSDCKITVSDCTYTGKKAKPKVTVTYDGNKVGSSNYTVTCSDSKVGDAKVTIKGKNSLTGSVTKTFDIEPKKVSSLKLSSPSAGKMKVSWKKSTSGNCSRYEIQYWRSSNSSSKKTVKVTGYKNTSKTISGLTKGKKYVVRIRQYKNGQYSDWTSTKSITVKK